MPKEHVTAGSLSGLKKALKKKHAMCKAEPPGEAPPTEMAKPLAKPTDHELFEQAMGDVREISAFRQLKADHARPKPATPSKYKSARMDVDKAEAEGELRRIVTRKCEMPVSGTDEYVEWTARNVTSDLARRLHKGEFSVGATLDLHGLTVEEAEAEFGAFMRESIALGLGCVKVIHGRGLRSPGRAVLKDAMLAWLTGPYRKRILAFSSARPRDGGLGAAYVLLRRK